jgi:glycosyltransferase involved in cell wall biosynthesis
MVDKIYQQADKIFVTSPSFVNAVVNRKKPVDLDKVYYWPQYAESFYTPKEKTKIDAIPDDDTFKIAFTGNIGTAQGLDILPETAKLLKEEKVCFVVVGDGRYQSEFEKHIDECGVRDKFILIPRVPATQIPDILSACDVGFISFNRTPLWEMTIPAKLQSYMACGKAIIASASGETKRIIEEARCGVCCEIGSPESLAQGIKKIAQSDVVDLGRNARCYFDSHFAKDKLMDEMDKYLTAEE